MNLSVSAPYEPPRAEPSRRELAPLVVELVRARARRRQAWLGSRSCADQGDGPQAEQAWIASVASSQDAELNARIATLDALVLGPEAPELKLLVELFRLEREELELMMTCVALHLDPSLRLLYTELQGGLGYATEALAARVFGRGWGRMWLPSGALARWGLIHTIEVGPGQLQPLEADPQIVAWLQGQLGLDAPLVGVAEVIETTVELDSWPLEETAAHCKDALARRSPLRVIIVGPRGGGQRAFAAALAARLGTHALAVDVDGIPEDSWIEAQVRVQRLALLGGLIPMWYGAALGRRWSRRTPPTLLQIIACEDLQEVADLPDAADRRVALPSPRFEERCGLWARAVAGYRTWTPPQQNQLASRYRLTVGDIFELGRHDPGTPEEAATLCRTLTRGRLGELGQLLDCPFTTQDLALHARLREQLAELMFEAETRARFWEDTAARRLFPRGTGLVALFAGAPGTGKTMAAQVIAAELELDLLRIDLATVVSKYIGETAKNLRRIFTQAARLNAILLFDEADALFSKRTEVKDSHDRYANTDTNYLLQQIEDYEGVAILATNKKSNIDPAFIRRIRYVFDFVAPTADVRLKIWRQVVQAFAGEGALPALDPGLAAVAEGVELSGAQIKNAALAAAFFSRQRGQELAIEHVVHGISRELSKEGRALSSRDGLRLGATSLKRGHS